jgi:hypothetical protein
VSALADYLRRHPLVWLVPVFFLVVVLGFLAWELAKAPSAPFIYQL